MLDAALKSLPMVIAGIKAETDTTKNEIEKLKAKPKYKYTYFADGKVLPHPVRSEV